MTGAARTVAAFDFDGTLVPGDSLIPFLRRVVPPAAFIRAFAGAWRELARIPLGGGHRDVAKAALLGRALRGAAVGDVSRAADAYAVVLERRLRKDTMARAAWHQEQGHEVVIVSASPEVYLLPLATRLGFSAVLSTRLEVEGGVLTGRLLGANVRGPEKVERLREWLGGEGVVLWAYGDSAGDTELLAAADIATRVGRDRLPTPPPAG